VLLAYLMFPITALMFVLALFSRFWAFAVLIALGLSILDIYLEWHGELSFLLTVQFYSLVAFILLGPVWCFRRARRFLRARWSAN
jgi:uncharacterized membrane protein